MNAFSILGIAPDAGPAEIKRAYRRLAMAWHPDRNAHPDATERFKAIRAAYDALQAREEDSAEAASPAEEPPAERQPSVPRAADIRLDLELSLEEAAFGCEKTIQVRRSAPCPSCEGSGEMEMTHSRLCRACHGSGRIRHRHHGLERCPDCDGRGFVSRCACPDCEGRGQAIGAASLQVRVPAGVLAGDELRLAGQGEPGNDELAPGDLFLRLFLLPHALFELQGCDLACAMPVNSLTLLAGGRIEVPILGGWETVQLEAGDGGPRTLRLAGQGYPERRSGQTGDLLIHLQPVMPQSLNHWQHKMLQAAAAACEDNLEETLPEVARWRARHSG